jgi:predicted kinase
LKFGTLHASMLKNKLQQPTIIYFLGMPGSGKTYISRQLCENLGAAHVSSDRIRYELFEQPRFDKAEHNVVTRLMEFMTEQFLNAGVSVVYDISVSRITDRRALRDIARKFGAKELMVWIQTDIDTAWNRTQSRDRRKIDDKYSTPIDQRVFDQYVRIMQNPYNEQYVVVSGKHVFNTQKAAILRRLQEMNALKSDANSNQVPKPGLVNLVSQAQAQAGRVDMHRRNISIR